MKCKWVNRSDCDKFYEKTDSPLTDAQSDEIRQAQSEAMQADPNLQPQRDELMKKMTVHQHEVDAAILKLDPTMTPIMAKFLP